MNLKDLENGIEKMIGEIKKDPRYSYKPALVQINAPLALIQVSMKSKVEALDQALSLIKQFRDSVGKMIKDCEEWHMRVHDFFEDTRIVDEWFSERKDAMDLMVEMGYDNDEEYEVDIKKELNLEKLGEAISKILGGD